MRIQLAVAAVMAIVGVSAAKAETVPDLEFPAVYHVEQGTDGAYETVRVGFEQELALIYKLDEDGRVIDDEFLSWCEYWAGACGNTPQEVLDSAVVFSEWAVAVMNGEASEVVYHDNRPEGMEMERVERYLREASTALRYPGLPGAWYWALEDNWWGSSAVWVESQYPNGGFWIDYNPALGRWSKLYGGESTAENEFLAEYTLHFLNGVIDGVGDNIPWPESEHPQIDEYTEFLREVRTDTEDWVYYCSYVPVTAR